MSQCGDSVGVAQLRIKNGRMPTVAAALLRIWHSLIQGVRQVLYLLFLALLRIALSRIPG